MPAILADIAASLLRLRLLVCLLGELSTTATLTGGLAFEGLSGFAAGPLAFAKGCCPRLAHGAIVVVRQRGRTTQTILRATQLSSCVEGLGKQVGRGHDTLPVRPHLKDKVLLLTLR